MALSRAKHLQGLRVLVINLYYICISLVYVLYINYCSKRGLRAQIDQKTANTKRQLENSPYIQSMCLNQKEGEDGA